MRSSVAAVDHAPEDAALACDAGGAKERRKVDDGARFSRRDVLAADSAILLRRAHDRAGIAASQTAARAGVCHQTASRWTVAPLENPPPLYSVLAHPIVTVEAAALLLERVALELVAAGPADIEDALLRVRAATGELEALVARRGR
jgi:hypothetical protein